MLVVRLRLCSFGAWRTTLWTGSLAACIEAQVDEVRRVRSLITRAASTLEPEPVVQGPMPPYGAFTRSSKYRAFMRALVVRRPTGPDSLEIIDTPVPEPGPGQVRIAVTAAAVNPIDLMTASGALVELGMSPPREQFGLGWDVAGTVDAVGLGVDLAVGVEVIGLSDELVKPLKTHAEFVVLDAAAVVPAPREHDAASAASFALNALTALQALDALDLPSGATVLITGAAGALGGFAVELAAQRNLRIIAVARAEDEQLVAGFGADLFVPRSDDPVPAIRQIVPEGVDGLIDAAALGAAVHEAVRTGGDVSYVFGDGAPPLGTRGITVREIFVNANAAELSTLVESVESKRLSIRVAATFPFDDAVGAYGRLAKGGVRGRIVLIL